MSHGRKPGLRMRRALGFAWTRRHMPGAVVVTVSLLLAVMPGHSTARSEPAQAPGGARVGYVSTGTMTQSAVVDLRSTHAGPHGSSHAPPSRPRRFPHGTPAQHDAQLAAAATNPAVPHAGTSSTLAPTTVSPTVLENFSGLNSTDSLSVNLADGTPPDQGLCVGPAGIVEAVNLAVAVYSPAGARIAGPFSLNALFGEPFIEALSDPRCYYDPNAQAWYFTILAWNPLLNNESHLDVAVDPSPGLTAPLKIYRITTTDPGMSGCPCLGDQPLLGVDAHGVFVTANEYPIVGSTFLGEQIYAISKSQLVSEATKPWYVHYGNLMNGGTQASSMQPAVTSGSAPAEYFLDSLDPNATTDNRLGVWALTNDSVLDTNGTPTLTGTVITVEAYGQPAAALQKGSTATLEADDDRMQQVQNVGGTLWGALDTAVRFSGDTSNRDGIAWFQIVPALSTDPVPVITGATVAGQGYVAIPGFYLLYPALAVNDIGNAAMVLSIAGASIYPSVAYLTGPTFTTGAIAALGTAPEHGLSCSPCRWGDYSAAVWSSIPSGQRYPDLWLASEYISGPGDALTTWATRILEVIPQGG